MHLPWIATIDALIASLQAERDFENMPDNALGAGSIGMGVDPCIRLEVMPPVEAEHVQVRLMRAIADLEKLRSDIRRIAYLLPYDPVERRFHGRTATLERLEQRMIRYPEQEGREGLARFIEKGALFGPIFGAHLAAVIRGEKTHDAGTQSSFDQGRERRYAVKHIMTIKRLYAISTAAAIRAYAPLVVPDDPEDRAEGRLGKWVTRLQKEARQKLAGPALSVKETLHWKGFIDGVRPDLPSGYLRGRSYPDGMDSLPPDQG